VGVSLARVRTFWSVFKELLVSEDELSPVRQKARLGGVEGQFDLGLRYMSGHDVPEDAAQAVEWFRKAALQGYAPAQALLQSDLKTSSGFPRRSARQP